MQIGRIMMKMLLPYPMLLMMLFGKNTSMNTVQKI